MSNKLIIILFSQALFCGSVVAQTSSSLQYCQPTIKPSTPTTNFIIHNDGTVTDKTTGLMWAQCMQGMTFNPTDPDVCLNTPTSFTFEDALLETTPPVLSSANYSDWRLPNYKELFSIEEVSCSGPSVNLAVFPSVTTIPIWTSTPGNYFLLMDQSDSLIDYADDDAVVRLVRNIAP